MKIIPATLRNNFEDIKKDIQSLNNVSDIVSIDICDGEFVPSLTWLPDDKNLEDFNEAKSFFYKNILENDVNFEFDLMVNDMSKYIDLVLKFGAKKVVIHSHDIDKIKNAIKMIDNYNTKIGFDSIVEIGLCIKDEVILKDFIEEVDYIQIMGIKKIGFQSQPFDESVIEKIKRIREFYDGILQIDGGMSIENIKKCNEAGADNFILGSKIFADGYAEDNYKNILIKENWDLK